MPTPAPENNTGAPDKRQWFVRMSNGSIFGPIHTRGLRLWAQEGRVMPDDEVSEDRKSWAPAQQVPELGMETLIERPDGTFSGPFHPDAIQPLIAEGKIPPDAKTFHRDELPAMLAARQMALFPEPGGAPAPVEPALQKPAARAKAERDAERAALKRENQRLAERLAELETERETLLGQASEEAAAPAAKDGTAAALEALQAERDSLAAERDATSAQIEALQAERDRLAAERDATSARIEVLQTERDRLATERDATSARIEVLQAERDSLAAERDATSAKLEAIQVERDSLAAERDTTSAKLEAIQAERNARASELEALQGETESSAIRVQQLTQALEQAQADYRDLLLFSNTRDAEYAARLNAGDRAESLSVADSEPVSARRIRDLEDQLGHARREAEEFRRQLELAQAEVARMDRPQEPEIARIRNFADAAHAALRQTLEQEREASEQARAASAARQESLHAHLDQLRRALSLDPGEASRSEQIERRNDRLIAKLKQELETAQRQHQAELQQAAGRVREVEQRASAIEKREAVLREKLAREELRATDRESLKSQLQRREGALLAAEREFDTARQQWQSIEAALMQRIEELESGASQLLQESEAAAPAKPRAFQAKPWMRLQR